MGHFNDAATRAAGLLLSSSLLVAGCSSSSDSGALTEDANVVSDIDSIVTTAQPEADPISSGVSDEVIGSANDPVEEAVEPVDPASESIPADTIVNEQNSEPTMEAVPDPLVQNITQVDFGITVPAYQSDALQVRLTWGDTDVTVGWVGDELWSTSLELPTNTENTLSVTFSDRNGDIELASFEQTYRTGSNAAEVFEIVAEQFDSDQWDTDNDGTSNLDELIAGTDPSVDEDSLLPIVDNQNMSLLFIANYLENLLPNERPYTRDDDNNVIEFGDETVSVTAGIDANGHGTVSAIVGPFRPDQNFRAGTRSVLEGSVQWEGSWRFTDDFNLRQFFTSEVSADGNLRSLVEVGNGSWVGTYNHRWNTTVSVTGQLIEGSSFCEVASGTITESYTTNDQGRNTTTTLTITRESVDELWRVSKVSENEFDEASTEEYFARELSMHMIRFGYQELVSENDLFFCDYAEL